MRRFRDTVTITVSLPADEAMPLFTARGERRWVEGWDPEFPAGEPTEEDEGTVWITTAGDRTTCWVVAAKDAERVRYARTTPGFAAGTVEVRRRGGSDARETELDITYDLTALTGEGEAELDDFAATFHQEIGSWEGLIRRLVAENQEQQ
jgi:hypothetical protein